jgi:23S rRNA (guanosine2251-2'-O)-methyltransferase
MARPGIGDSVEGVHAVAAALAAGRVRRLLVEESRLDALSDLVDAATSAGAAIETVGDVRDRASTSAPQGVVAICDPIPDAGIDGVVEAVDPPAVVVLDRLEDPRNVGAIARSAVAAGVLGLVVPTHRSAPLGATAFKAAAGALEHMAITQVSSVADAVARLSARDVWTVGLDSDGDRPLFGLDLLSSPVALVVGAEGAGLSRLVRDRVDVVASIPLSPMVESLNASVAASLAVFEIARVRAGA